MELSRELKMKWSPSRRKKELPEGACGPVEEASSISLEPWAGGLGKHCLPAVPSRVACAPTCCGRSPGACRVTLSEQWGV